MDVCQSSRTVDDLWKRWNHKGCPVTCSCKQNRDNCNRCAASIAWLTGCDTTSKICNKTAALKIADTDVIENLVAFGKTDINFDMTIVIVK